MNLTPRIIVIGGGHAGIEAAAAAATMGAQVLFITQDPAAIGRMSCNPAIGGIGKGQIVREIDALGGRMGYLADCAGIQFKVLNRRKGPAVQSSRCQCDRRLYQQAAQEDISQKANVVVRRGGVKSFLIKAGRIAGVVDQDGEQHAADAVVLCAGTFLEAVTHVGSKIEKAGRYGEPPAEGLSGQLRDLGFAVGRLKTGTPPRLAGSTIDYSLCEIQPGDEPPRGFSRRRPVTIRNQVVCWLTYTTMATHEVIGANFDRSPLFNGQISGIGPRYCPSIEDKVKKFAEKPRHQLFLEPEGMGTDEIYINGFSTSLPADVQLEALRTIPALRRVEMTRPGYAVEYDFFPPTQLKLSLETKIIYGLFFAGQINGTSGYEEAAGQGLVAGINAVLYCRAETPFVLNRAESYIGVMIDDLVTLGVDEPYRMFTSRAEHRLHLREDNAERRLTYHAVRLGLRSQREFDALRRRWDQIDRAIAAFGRTTVPGESLPYAGLRRQGGATLDQLLRIPEVRLSDLRRYHPELEDYDPDAAEEIEVAIKYRGYIERQQRQIEQFQRMESQRIPETLSYASLPGLRRESVEKFARIRPATLGQASRIPGITSADLNLLMIHLKAGNGRSEGD
ncbi:MAG TPA: tRNA uridine-5-carboxymethylaminomethyl(34) synthesis enzyme MnmG [bacterium]|nr:tRNA uridine-5-carboxymethylaminomethyl(34) synthesis enzyme MnmG [bacterium]